MYEKIKLNISDQQKTKIKKALDNDAPVRLQIRFEDFKNGSDIIGVTKTQLKKMEDAFQKNKGVTLKLSKAQIKHNMKIEGGFLGMLAGLAAKALPWLAQSLGVGALSGLASTGVQKALGNGLFLKKGGCVCQIETDGKGLYLSPVNGLKSRGDGLFLSQNGKLFDGRGLILGKNSPFKNIPILGLLL